MKNRNRYDAEPITRGDLDRAMAKLSSAIQMGIITPKRSGGGGPDGKALVAMLDGYLGSTAWQSGSAAEIVAAIEGVTADITFTADIQVPTKTPTSAADTGTAGTITWDGDFLYVCSATDTWLRAAIATWV